MKLIHTSMVAMALCLTGGSVLAQEQSAAAADRPLKFVLGFGVTSGGDKLAVAETYGSEQENVKAGDGIDARAGLEYRFGPGLSVQATLGHHEDRVSDWGGDRVGFRRSTVELLGHVHLTPAFRIGGGVRKSWDAAFVDEADDLKITRDYTGRYAPVVEGEYFFNQRVSIKGRYVNERFKSDLTGATVKGGHAGVYVGLYF